MKSCIVAQVTLRRSRVCLWTNPHGGAEVCIAELEPENFECVQKERIFCDGENAGASRTGGLSERLVALVPPRPHKRADVRGPKRPCKIQQDCAPECRVAHLQHRELTPFSSVSQHNTES